MSTQALLYWLKPDPVVPLEAKDKYYMLDPHVQDLTLSYSNITVDWAYAGIAD